MLDMQKQSIDLSSRIYGKYFLEAKVSDIIERRLLLTYFNL